MLNIKESIAFVYVLFTPMLSPGPFQVRETAHVTPARAKYNLAPNIKKFTKSLEELLPVKLYLLSSALWSTSNLTESEHFPLPSCTQIHILVWAFCLLSPARIWIEKQLSKSLILARIDTYFLCRISSIATTTAAEVYFTCTKQQG